MTLIDIEPLLENLTASDEDINFRCLLEEAPIIHAEPFLYCAKDLDTGKFVSDLTNPRRKYWDREGNAENAIKGHLRYHPRHQRLALVKLALIPIDEREIR